MMDFLNMIFNSLIFGRINLGLSIIITIIFLFLFFGKAGKDERGRGIFAISCFYALSTFFIIVSVTSIWPNFIIQNKIVFMNYIEFVYNLVMLVVVAVCLILRKRQ